MPAAALPAGIQRGRGKKGLTRRICLCHRVYERGWDSVRKRALLRGDGGRDAPGLAVAVYGEEGEWAV
jgi:hypothetical protein